MSIMSDSKKTGMGGVELPQGESSRSVEFSSKLAAIVFGEEPMRECEAAAVDSLSRFLRQAGPDQIEKVVDSLNRVLGQFEGVGIRAAGAAIQAIRPDMMAKLPIMVEHERRLTKAYELASVFSGENLKRLSAALKEEGVGR